MNIDNLKDLEVTAGNQVTITAVTDTPCDSATASIVDINLTEISTLSSVFSGGDTLAITIPGDITKAAVQRGKILQIVWDYSNGEVENTRVHLVGKLC